MRARPPYRRISRPLLTGSLRPRQMLRWPGIKLLRVAFSTSLLPPDFEIGRVQDLRSEIRNLKLNCLASRRRESNRRFRISDLRSWTRPISKFLSTNRPSFPYYPPTYREAL